MSSINIVHDSQGHLLRVEYNGVTLPVGDMSSVTVDQRVWPAAPVIHLTLMPDEVVFTFGEVDSSTVDADAPPRLIEPPSDSTA